MKLIRNIIGRTLAFWALFMFAASMFLYMWFYLYCLVLREPQKTKWHRRVSQWWMSTFMIFSGIRFSVRGKNVFDNLENAVVVCNHNSLLDIPVSFPVLPRANKTIAKNLCLKYPYSVGFIP